MSHWGYVIEQLINEDEKSRIAREHRRKRKLVGAASRNPTPPSEPSAPKRRLSWALLTHRS